MNCTVIEEINNTGMLSIKSPFDYEIMKTYQFIVYASTINVVPEKRAFTMVQLEIIDMNDNAPKFDQSNYRFEVPENNELGALVGVVSAKDEDSGINQKIEYLVEGKGQDIFVMNNGAPGRLLTRVRFDREIKSEYSISIMAKNTAIPYLNSTVAVTIVITDVNDNSPVIELSAASVDIAETEDVNKELVSIQIRDSDSSESNYFIVTQKDTLNPPCCYLNYKDKSSLTLNLLRKIQYSEETSKIQVTMTAKDEGDLISKPAMFTINILKSFPNFPDDINRSVTIFDNLTISTIVMVVKAGTGSYIYQLSGSNSKDFTVLQDGTIITNRELNAARTPEYSLQLAAFLNSLSAKTQIKIQVTPSNSKPPVFLDPNNAAISIDENETKKDLFDVKTKDEMSGIPVLYELAATNNPFKAHFRINQTTGVIDVIQPFDRELNPKVYVLVSCQRNLPPSPGQISTENITITILDKNDNSPSFSIVNNYFFAIISSESINNIVQNIKAIDPDYKSKLFYSLYSLSKEYSDFLSINSLTGDISVLQSPIIWLNQILLYQITVNDLDEVNRIIYKSSIAFKTQIITKESLVTMTLGSLPLSDWSLHRSRYLSRLSNVIGSPIHAVDSLTQSIKLTDSSALSRQTRDLYDAPVATSLQYGTQISIYSVVNVGMNSTQIMSIGDLMKLLDLKKDQLSEAFSANLTNKIPVSYIAPAETIQSKTSRFTAIEIALICICVVLVLMLIILLVVSILVWRRKSRANEVDFKPSEMIQSSAASRPFNYSNSAFDAVNGDQANMKRSRSSSIAHTLASKRSSNDQPHLISNHDDNNETRITGPTDPIMQNEFDTRALDAVIASYGQ